MRLACRIIKARIQTHTHNISYLLFLTEDEKRLKASQMKFLRYLLGITKLDRERKQSVRENLRVQNIVLEIQQ
jgi:hypothetical protein